jgi:hypothetical protein
MPPPPPPPGPRAPIAVAAPVDLNHAIKPQETLTRALQHLSPTGLLENNAQASLVVALPCDSAARFRCFGTGSERRR